MICNGQLRGRCSCKLGAMGPIEVHAVKSDCTASLALFAYAAGSRSTPPRPFGR